MWSSETREGLAVCGAKEEPSFLFYVRTLSTAWPRNRTHEPSVLRRWHQLFRHVMQLIQVSHYFSKSLSIVR